MPSISLPTALIAGSAAGLGGSLISSNASKSAAQTQANAANQAAQLQQQMFQQTQQNLAPYVQAGVPATNGLSALLGLPSAGGGAGGTAAPGGGFTGTAMTNVNGSPITVGGTAPTNPTSGTEWLNTAGQTPQLEVWDQSSGRYGIPSAAQIPGYLGTQTPQQVALAAEGSPNATSSIETALQQTPGYQFTLDQGLQAITNKASATGGVNGGNTLKALMQYGTGLADQTYQQQVGNYLNLAGLGESAAAGQGALSANVGSTIGNTLTSGAAATAAGQVGSANALTSGISGLGSNFLLASLLQSGGLGGSGQASGIPYGYDGLV